MDFVGVGGLEPPTSALSELRSNRLSYTPAAGKGTTRPRGFESGYSRSVTSSSIPPTTSAIRL